MAPAYVMHGQISMKSDVYSFGVLVLELISGKMNSSFCQMDGSADNLVTHVWRLWRKGSLLELLDPAFGKSYKSEEVRICIHIALLCVQEDLENRPMISTSILILSSSSITLHLYSSSIVAGTKIQKLRAPFFWKTVSMMQQFQKVCGDSLFFQPNGTYDTNRQLVLSTLASNVVSQDGFYNVSVGEGPGRIYVMGMCIPGIEPQTCSYCMQAGSEYILQHCPNQTDSFDWSPQKALCYVRYSNSSFFDELSLEPYQAEYYTGDIPGNVTEFNRLWEEFMRRMITAASSSTPVSPARRYYAADMIPFTGFINIYALMHCIPGISSGDCEKCLLANVRTQQQCCSKNTGSAVRRPVCFSRSSIAPFYGAFDNLTLSPPPQSPQIVPPPSDLPIPTKKDVKTMSRGILIAIIVVASILALLLVLGFASWKKRKSYKSTKLGPDNDDIIGSQSLKYDDIIGSLPKKYDLKTIEAATDNFSIDNVLGKGGFGVVYKGKLRNGTKIAVKNLSITSRQGLQEFQNEVQVAAKLQHNNLVKLLGYCSEGDVKIIVFEFLPNKSLDLFLFDAVNKRQLDWPKRYDIIEGIARGIQYLHVDSRLKIIHRDLKVSNILLDVDMKPKIADFGLAKIFEMEQTRAETSKIAGTLGYMPPEYLSHGQFSMESDVYSFGVLVLEIISGNTCSNFYRIDDTDCNLGTYAWKLWRKDSALEFVDSSFGENYNIEQATRCIHMALQCVQADCSSRPKLRDIISTFTTSKISQSLPRKPGFFVHD